MNKRVNSAAPGKSRPKKVNFSAAQVKIDAPSDNTFEMPKSTPGLNVKPQLLEFYVEKAREYETFKQIPRFTKPNLAVIHPSPCKLEKQPRHRPPKSLQFDGIPISPMKRPKKENNIPEHLRKPEISEEKLAKIRQREELRKLEAKNPANKKKKSLEATRAEKQIAVAKSDIKFRISGAEKNLKLLFGEFKKVLDKHDEEKVFDGTEMNAYQAKEAAVNQRYVSFLFNAWAETTQADNYRGERVYSKANSPIQLPEFVMFMRYFKYSKDGDKQKESLRDDKVIDIFMNVNKTLPRLLAQIAVSPHQSRMEDSSTMQGGHDPFYRTMDNSDIPMMNLALQRDFKVSNYGMQPDEVKNQLIEIPMFDALYAKWAEEDSSLQGITNNKHTAQHNKDFQLKLEAWRARAIERKGAKKRVIEHEKALRDFFNELVSGYNRDPQRAIDCVHKFDEFTENMKGDRKLAKVIMNFLADMPKSTTLSSDDLDRQLKNYQVAVQQKMDKIEDFAEGIKEVLFVNQHYFIFFDVPGYVASKNYSRQDYDNIYLKFLQKVKLRYLARKAMLPEFEGRALDKIVITEDDMVPFEVLDDVISEIKNKNSENMKTILTYIKGSKEQIQLITSKLQIENPKTKKIIEYNVLIDHLNKTMEKKNEQNFKNNFIHRNLYVVFIRQMQAKNQTIHSPKEFEIAFTDVFNIFSQKYVNDYKHKLELEQLKFNGLKPSDGDAETMSEMTGIKSRKSGKSGSKALSKGSRTSSPEKLLDADDRAHQMDGTLNDRDDAFDPDPERTAQQALDDEDEMEAERLRQEAIAKGKTSDTEYQRFFVEADTGQEFDPKKKFGTIGQEGTLIYENVTTSYPVQLPAERYQKYIMDNLPKKEDGDGNWFIRPHHLENLTQHPKSIKDDVLNTNYYSHYNLNEEKEEDPAETAIEKIESHLAELKAEMFSHMMRRGEDPQKLETMQENCVRESMEAYDKFISDRTRQNNKVLIIQAYEDLLTFGRRGEKDILNKQRNKEYERNRPPCDKWYEMKSSGFQKELYRNRVALKPNNTNAVYLENLQDKYLY